MSSTGHASKMKFTRSRYIVMNTFFCALCKAKEFKKINRGIDLFFRQIFGYYKNRHLSGGLLCGLVLYLVLFH